MAALFTEKGAASPVWELQLGLIVPNSRRRSEIFAGLRTLATGAVRGTASYQRAMLSVAPISLAAFGFSFCSRAAIGGKGLADVVALLELAT